MTPDPMRDALQRIADGPPRWGYGQTSHDPQRIAREALAAHPDDQHIRIPRDVADAGLARRGVLVEDGHPGEPTAEEAIEIVAGMAARWLDDWKGLMSYPGVKEAHAVESAALAVLRRALESDACGECDGRGIGAHHGTCPDCGGTGIESEA